MFVCFILDSLVAMSSCSLIFFSAMSNLPKSQQVYFFILDFVIFIFRSLICICFISYMSLLNFWTYIVVIIIYCPKMLNRTAVSVLVGFNSFSLFTMGHIFRLLWISNNFCLDVRHFNFEWWILLYSYKYFLDLFCNSVTWRSIWSFLVRFASWNYVFESFLVLSIPHYWCRALLHTLLNAPWIMMFLVWKVA